MGNINNQKNIMGMESEREKFIRGVLLLIFVILMFWLLLYGAIRASVDAYHFITKDKEQLSSTEFIPRKPGTPYVVPRTYDFSGIDKTLKGIERQLEHMNKIREAEKGGDLEWEK